MTPPDFNLLVLLEALLREGSVAGAARRLRLSPSATSRALTRLREAMGDPLLVRAGRTLVPTPRAIALRERIGPLLQEVEAVLRPAAALDLRQLERTFTLRNREGFVESFALALIARAEREAPKVKLRFVPKIDRDSAVLRDASVDLETGVIGTTIGPEVRTQGLFRDRYVGVVRSGHALCEGVVTLERYLAARHVLISRRMAGRERIDAALEEAHAQREIATMVGSFSEALSLVRGSDWIASVPERCTQALRGGLFAFALPFAAPEITVSLFWHPRMDADPAHRWLRGCVLEVCRQPL